ncbi:hypothetical protein EVAR_63298_1 [Eumeta japonica]|uniref:DUF4817 domain-containing protein n=1 Tax=Eumeta variegata TaxID=151549 RepID=A0A4C1ZRK9_EUMVA|nr:hypothetical protein EVAR_63298_1 [Eumeta japonica]
MASFNAREYGEMIIRYGEARGNASAYQRVLENRPIVLNQEDAGRPVRSETQERVLDLVRQNPRLGTRTVA